MIHKFRWKSGVLKITAVILICLLNIVVVTAEDAKGCTRGETVKILVDVLKHNGFAIPAGLDVFADTKDPAAQAAAALKLVQGDEHGRFNEQEPLKLQDLLVMFHRLFNRYAPDIYYNTMYIHPFADGDKISGYAKPSVDMLSIFGIYLPFEGNEFRPLSVPESGQVRVLAQYCMEQMKSAPRSRCGVMPRKKVPVLMYHCISQYEAGANQYLFVSPKHFEDQIRYLRDNNYQFLFPEELSYADKTQKSVVLTLDDGYLDNYTNAYPILKKYGAKATIFIPSDYIGKTGYLSAGQLKEMSDSGFVRIYSHGKTHTDMSKMSAEECEREYRESNDRITAITGREVLSFTYPNGRYSQTSLTQAKRFYRVAFLGLKGKTTKEGEPHSLRRITADGRESLEQFMRRAGWKIGVPLD